MLNLPKKEMTTTATQNCTEVQHQDPENEQ
jgi:hypothetical protein